MRNDSEHVPKTSEASRRRGALARTQPHRPRLTVSRKLWLGFGVLLLLLLAGGIFIEHSMRTIEANLKQITEIEEPERAAAFEMEINLTGTSFAVLGYHHDRDPAHLARIEDYAVDFAQFQQQYRELALRANNEEELNLSARVDEGYIEFTSLASDLIALEDLQFEKMGLLRQNLEQMDEILNNQIQDSLDPSDPDSNLKLHAVHEMGISANDVARELENYLRSHDTQYAERTQEDSEEFERSLTMYASLGLSSQERQWADDLHSLFIDCVALAQEIIELDKAEVLGIASFFRLRQNLDILFVDEIRAVTQTELADAKADADRSVNFAQWALLALLIGGLTTGGAAAAVIISRGISKPLGKLAAGVEHVSRGDLSYVIDVDSSDEIGELAAAFNHMTTNLALITASRDELDKEIEERKQMEEALRESEGKFSVMAESSPAATFIFQGTGLCYVNSAAEAMTGYSREELLAMSFWDMIHPAYREQVKERGLARQRGEHVQSVYELMLLTKDGRECWVEFSGGSIEFDGRPAAIGTAFDITERKQTEKALQASEAKYRTFFENVQDIFFQTDTDGVIVEISPSVESFGYTKDALIGTSVLDIYENPEQREEVVTAILEHGEISDFEIRLKTGDGRGVDISLSAHTRYDADGGPLGVEGVLRDITARKQAENALRESESQVRVLLENASQGIVVIDSAGRIQLINARTEELFGYERVELIGQPVDMLLPERLRSAHAMALENYFSHPRVRQMGAGLDIIGRRKNGTEFPLEIGVSVTDWNGQPVGIASIMDITVRKQAENALERSLEAERERARRDPLTGVLNHGAIVEELRKLVSSSADGSSHTVAMVDVDGLKAVNDTYGHRVGDAVLTTMAGALSRDGAIVGRYGGDEFVVVLRDMDRAAAERYRDAVPEALANAGLTDPESGANIPVSASIGLACYPEEAESIAELINLADSAMYAAKRQRPVEPGQLARKGPLGSNRAAEMVGALVPLLTSPGDLNDKLRLVSHHLSVGAGYDAVDFSMFAPEPGTPLAQDTFARGANDLLDAWQREQRDDSPEPHPLRLLFKHSPRPVILNDPWNDELLLPGQRDILRAAGLKSVLVAPLVWQDHVLGSLGVANRQKDAFTPADAQFLMAVAAQVTAIMRMKTVVADLKASSANLSKAHEETVLLLAAAAEAHDRTTGLHLQSVRDLTEALAHELGYAEADAIALGVASVLHDIGKVRVPDTILTSPAKLEGGQWEIMKQHTTWGADFLSGHQGFELATIVALHHHEHWDGGGYPEGIAGDLIPEAATIVAVADALDAITHNRPYREGRSIDEAVAEIAAHSGKQFNPRVVAVLQRLCQRNELSTAYPEVIDTETAA